MKRILLYIFLITIGFTSCIKEEVEPSNQGQLVTNEVYIQNINNVDQLVFRGSIIAFGPIDVLEHGFVFIKTNGTVIDPIDLDFNVITNTNKVNLGSIDKAKKFTHEIINPPSGEYRVRSYTIINGVEDPQFGNLIVINF